MEPRDASTVLLLRDGAEGLEVFMVRRHLDADFVGGAYVFPGGAVDPEDAADLADLVAGIDDAEASEVLGVDGGLRFYIAAVREVFEESGVLLAYDRQGRWIEAWDPADIARFAEHRSALNRGAVTMAEVCREEGLRIAADRLVYFSHWITPVGAPRRFDTRFFLAAMPSLQDPLHDDTETVDSMWIRPADALAQAERGEASIIFPTAKSLEEIGAHATVEQALAAARARPRTAAILPKVIHDEGGIRALLPGDPGYDDAPDEGVGRFRDGHMPSPTGRLAPVRGDERRRTP